MAFCALELLTNELFILSVPFSLALEYDLCHIAVHLTTVESKDAKIARVLWKGHGNLIGEVKVGVYSHSRLGEMHGLW